MIDVVLGIDIGGTNTKLGLVSEAGENLRHLSIPTRAEQPISYFLEHLVKALQQLKSAFSEDVNVKGIGMGAPNGNYHNGHIEKAPNLHWGDDVPMGPLIKQELGLPVWLTNDANAAAIGEMKFGTAKGMKNFVVITLGTGLGSGLVMNGELVYGHDGFAGEIGHNTIIPGGREHSTQRKGSIETYVSATGVKRTVAELLASRIERSEMRQSAFEDISAKQVAELALKGDPVALEAFEYTGRLLGIGLADTVILCDPEAIIVFGGMAASGDLIMKPTEKYLNQYLPSYLRGKTKLMLSNLTGGNTAILGAAALAWDEIHKMELQAS